IFYFVGLPPYKNAAALFFFTIIYTFEFSARLGKMTLQNYFCKVILLPPPAFLSSEIKHFSSFFYFPFLPHCSLNKNAGIAAEISPLHINSCLFSKFSSS